MEKVRVHADDVICGFPLPGYQFILALLLNIVNYMPYQFLSSYTH